MGVTEGPKSRRVKSLSELSRRDLLRHGGQFAAVGAFSGGIVSFLAACGGDSGGGSTAAGGTVRKGGSVSTPTTFEGLNPITNTTTVDRSAHSMLFDGLIGWDPNGKPVPLLAEDLGELSDDNLTYTFKLRDGLKWSDGKPLTSKDVVMTYEMLYLPKYKDVASSYRADADKYLKSAEAVDDRTVKLTLKQAYAPFLLNLCFIPPLPAHVFEGMSGKEINKSKFGSEPTACSGAFKFVEWVKQDHATFARNENYWGDPAPLDKIVLTYIPPGQSSTNSLKTGELGWALVTNATEYEQLKNDPSLATYLIPDKGITNYWYQLDPSKSPAGKIFADKAVRQALVWGLNREGMNKALYRGTGDVGDSFFATVSWAYNKNVSPTYGYDVDKAGSMLDAAGWTKGSKGVREKDGQPLKFTITTAANAAEYVQAAEAMASDWKKLGCDVSVKPIQYPQLLSTAYFDRKFDIIIPGFGFRVDPDLSFIFHSRNIAQGGQNAGSYKNAEVDRLLDEGVETTDEGKRKELYDKLGDILAEDVPTVPMVRTKGFVVHSKKIHGLTPETYGTFTAFINRRFVNQVWTEA